MDKNFLDKVVYQLESETKIDAVKEEIHFQFLPLDEIYGSNTFHIPYFDFLFIYNSLFKHCKEVYGLNEEESEYVWTEYENNTKFHLLTQGNGGIKYLEESNNFQYLNENMLKLRKTYPLDVKYLNNIVNQIVFETGIDYGRKKLYPPDPKGSEYSFSFLDYLTPYIPSFFDEQCKDVYGLNFKETRYVWKEYKKNIRNIINNELEIFKYRG